MFKNDIENSAEIVPSQWEQRGILERVEETAARIAEPLL
jgi:hypothetical protein